MLEKYKKHSHQMCDSVTANVTSSPWKRTPCGLWLLLPLMHKSALRSKLKHSFVRMRSMVELADSSRFSAIFSPSLLKNLLTIVPNPPKQVKINGVKVLCLTFSIRLLYFAFSIFFEGVVCC